MDSERLTTPKKNEIKDQLCYVKSRINFYASQIELNRLKLITKSQAPSKAYEKAFRCLCLTIKALGNLMDCPKVVNRQEMFVRWESICSFINSDYGEYHINCLKNTQKLLEKRGTTLVCKQTVSYLRNLTF